MGVPVTSRASTRSQIPFGIAGVRIPRHGDHRAWLLGLYGLVLGTMVYLLAYRGLTDDGYITLDYARTLADHGVWGMKAGLESNTATSPLNVLLIAVLMLVTKLFTGDVQSLLALGLLTVASMVAASVWWAVISRRLAISGAAAAAGLGLVLLSPLALSAIGLETPLLVALLIGLFAEALRGRPVVFGVLAGLAVLTRLDAVVFVLVIGLGMTAVRRKWYRALIPMVLIALPWFVTSWFVLGSAIPDTLAIKQQQTYPDGWTFWNGVGLFIGGNTRVPTVTAFAPAALGLLALLAWAVLVRRGRLAPLALFAGCGVLYYGVYCLLGVPPYLWYYVPTVAVLTLFFGAALDPLARLIWRRRQSPVAAALSSLVLAATLVVNLGHGIPWQSPPIFGNFALPADYMRVGHDLKARIGDGGVLSPGELGTLVYACDCNVLDQFSDRGQSIKFLRAQVDKANPVVRALYRFNYRNLDWQTKPRPAQWRLVWQRGWVPPAKDVWNVNSPGIGQGRFVLLPISAPVPPPQ